MCIYFIFLIILNLLLKQVQKVMTYKFQFILFSYFTQVIHVNHFNLNLNVDSNVNVNVDFDVNFDVPFNFNVIFNFNLNFNFTFNFNSNFNLPFNFILDFNLNFNSKLLYYISSLYFLDIFFYQLHSPLHFRDFDCFIFAQDKILKISTYVKNLII